MALRPAVCHLQWGPPRRRRRSSRARTTRACSATTCCAGETISKRPPPISGSSVVEPPDGSAFTQIAAGGDHTCGATTSGELYCWGTDSPSPQKLSGGPYFDDLRGGTGEAQTPPGGGAPVDSEPDPNVGIGPPPPRARLSTAGM